jgi:hypothetical protein
MVKQSLRAFPRIEIESFVSYLAVDRNRQILGQGVGKVVNLSQGGIMLETGEPVEAPFVLLSVPDAEDHEVTLLGQVAHCRRNGSGDCRIGIKFLGNDDKKRGVITGIVKSHSRLKHLK